MDPESSLYIMSALAHQKLFPVRQVIQRNRAKHCLMKLVFFFFFFFVFFVFFFYKHSGAVGMSPDSEGLGAAFEAGVGSNLTQSSGISYLSSIHFFF